MSVAYVTEHFSWLEVACKDGADCPLEYQPNARRLAETVLEPIREAFGGPLIPISWYRSAGHNRAVGGAAKSQHLTASGVDIQPVSLAALPRLRGVIESLIAQGKLPNLGGYGTYNTFVHVDIRPRGKDDCIARWTGKGFGSET